MVYLIDFGTCYKIGRTLDLKKRLKTFLNAREDVKCLDLINKTASLLDPTSEDIEIEKTLHRMCRNYHISNEMFQKTEEVLDIFLSYKKEVGDINNYSEELLNLFNENKDNKKSCKRESTAGKDTFQYSLSGEFLKKYNSRREAEEDNSMYYGKIKEVIAGRQLTTGGFIWSDHLLSDEEIREKLDKINKSRCSKLNKNTKLVQLDKEDNIIREWDTMTQASKELNISVSSISLCCKGTYKTAGGFKWKIC